MAACCSHYGILQEEIKVSRSHKRVYGLFVKAAGLKPSTNQGAGGRELSFVFFRNPAEILPSSDGARVGGVKLEKTVLQGDFLILHLILDVKRTRMKTSYIVGITVGTLQASVDLFSSNLQPELLTLQDAF